MTIINDNTVVINSFAELKSVLEGVNLYNYVYFGDDIKLTGGIKINASKESLVIDGTYEGIMHKYEDANSLSASETINVQSASTLKVTVSNMTITGNNYYGVIYVPESSTYKNTIIEYNNVIYNGPQMSFNACGLTRFIDCQISIGDTSLTTGNEVAECNRIELGGTTKIIHSSKSNSSFWFRNDNPSLKVLANSSVEFISYSRELIYGTKELNFEVLNNATFSVTTHSGMGYGSYGTGNTIIYPNASFILKQTSSNGSYASWYSYGKITLEKGSSLEIINDYSGIGTTNYNIYFNSATSGFILNDPKYLMLYNEKANVINTNSTSSFEFNFSRINMFEKVVLINENISTSNMPLYSWYKTSDISSIKGTFTSSKTTITANNFTESELEKLPLITNFSFVNKKIITVGTMLFKPNAVTDTSTKISGISLPNSSVLIRFNDTESVIVCNDNGEFSYELDSTLPLGTIIYYDAKKYDDLIYYTKSITTIYSGEITIDEYPKVVTFDLKPISTNPVLCPKNNELSLVISDSRVDSTDWELYALVPKDLTNENSEVLEKSLVFIDENKVINVLNENKTLVYKGEKNDGNTKITNITWAVNEGILLEVLDNIQNNTEYKANIIWTIITK